ncbi:hypothetical protein F2Q70_00016057 [Brassica cretica]|uniref:Uncharacterized protein n=1 Tax=Brassica cretica TaxID=69181 RepID=A0A8S9HS74_BRACR|nr:hypothetical protein F2Q70_00016057 [Brassica cretica]
MAIDPSGFAWAIYEARFHTRVQSKTRAAIPGPAGLPIIGLLLAFVNNALTHRILASIANSCNAKALMAFSISSVSSRMMSSTTWNKGMCHTC